MSIDLLNCDCMEYMATQPDKSFDLAIVDPPYGIGQSGDKNKTRGLKAISKDYKAFHGSDLSSPTTEYFLELKRVSKNQIIFGANHFIENIPPDRSSSCWIVWDKLNGATDFADCELAYTSFKTSVRAFRFKWQGMLQGDMKHKEFRIHPTQKPVALYKWLLKNYSTPGQRILDTHLGSGSSAIAAHYFGVDFVGCELDEDYFNAAVKRFNKETRQLSMFTSPHSVEQLRMFGVK